MRERNFLANFLRGGQPMAAQQPVATQQQQQPIQLGTPAMPQTTPGIAGQAPTVSGDPLGGLTPLSVLDSKEALARSLMEQSQNRDVHPLARGLSAFMGAKSMQDVSAQRAQTEGAIRQAEAQRERLRREEDIALKREGFDIQRQGLEAQERRFERQSQLDEERLKLDRDKFNQSAVRDAQNNAITKIPSSDGKVDLLFKGNAPVNEGLERGQQWAVDKEGNRVAVPIATQPTEKAQQSKQMTLEVVNRLLDNEEGVRDNFGVFDRFTPNVQEETRQAATDLDQLKSLLTVENLGLMSGVLSETDIKILQNVSAAAFSEGATEEGALNALKNLKKSLGSNGAKADEFEGFKVKGQK